MSRRKKARSGTWVERELLFSRAFSALPGSAKQILLLLLLKRDMSKNHICTNCDNITMTYLELENLHGEGEGMSRSSIPYAIDALLAKGFIVIVRQGGAFQKDKTVYGLTEDWRYWKPGTVIRTRTKGVIKSRNTSYENLNRGKRTRTHPPD